MKTYGGVNVYIHAFLTSTIVGVEWSVSLPGRFTPEKDLPYPSDRTLVGLQSRSGRRAEEFVYKISPKIWLQSKPTVMLLAGRSIAQAVSRWLPTAAALVRTRVWLCGICGR
jgi:hypothetical protein